MLHVYDFKTESNSLKTLPGKAQIGISRDSPVAESERSVSGALNSETPQSSSPSQSSVVVSFAPVVASRPAPLQRSPPAVFVSPKVLRVKPEPPLSKPALLKPSVLTTTTAPTSTAAAALAARRSNATLQALSQVQARNQGKVLQGGGKGSSTGKAETPQTTG